MSTQVRVIFKKECFLLMLSETVQQTLTFFAREKKQLAVDADNTH